MKVEYRIEKLSLNNENYVLWKRLKGIDSWVFKERVGTTFEEVIGYVRRNKNGMFKM